MPSAMLPANEPDRLRALRASGLLERGGDARLDEIVGRAAKLFGVPIAAISLLGEATQHFKASVGLGVPITSRDIAFCGFTILGAEPLVVMDATTDPRFVDNPLVVGSPGIRFYAGTSVFGQRRLPLGALCVIDVRPRKGLSPDLLAALQGMADEVSDLLAGPLGPIPKDVA